MWWDKAGLFMDRFEIGHERIKVRTPGGVIPMLAGIPTHAQAKKLVGNDLFWTDFPVTTLDLNDPDYNDSDEYFSYWNGRVWPQINWVIIEALCRAKFRGVAGELAMKSIRMCNATGEPWCMETYHPKNQTIRLKVSTFDSPHWLEL